MNVRPPADLKDYRNEDAIAFDARTADKYSDKGSVLHFALRLGFFPNTEEEAESIIQKKLLELEFYETWVSLHFCD
jgi:hypothetical protein